MIIALCLHLKVKQGPSEGWPWRGVTEEKKWSLRNASLELNKQTQGEPMEEPKEKKQEVTESPRKSHEKRRKSRWKERCQLNAFKFIGTQRGGTRSGSWSSTERNCETISCGNSGH